MCAEEVSIFMIAIRYVYGFSPFQIAVSRYIVNESVVVVMPVVFVVLNVQLKSTQQIATDSNKTFARRQSGSLSSILTHSTLQPTADITNLSRSVHTRRPRLAPSRPITRAYLFRPNLRTWCPGRIPVVGRSHSSRSGRGPHQVRCAAWIERHDVVFVGNGLV